MWNVQHLGPVAMLEGLPAEISFVVGIASPAARRRIVEAHGGRRTAATVVHPNTHWGRGSHVRTGSVICSHVSIENNVQMGSHVHVNQNATLGHDTRLDDYVTVSPMAAVSGNVNAAPEAFVGTGASIRQGLAIGAQAVVGMGAAVISDVPPGVTVCGVPAAAKAVERKSISQARPEIKR